MKSLRSQVVDLMTEIHLIPRELAVYHVRRMDDIEITRRFCMYTGMELSAAGANLVRATSCHPALTTRDDDGTLSALNPVPELLTEQRNPGAGLPDSEVKSRVHNPPRF